MSQPGLPFDPSTQYFEVVDVRETAISDQAREAEELYKRAQREETRVCLQEPRSDSEARPTKPRQPPRG